MLNNMGLKHGFSYGKNTERTTPMLNNMGLKLNIVFGRLSIRTTPMLNNMGLKHSHNDLLLPS